MSTISNRHSVIPFIAGSSKPLTDQRLTKITYKSRKGTPQKFPNVCVSLPVLAEPTDQEMTLLMPHLCALLETAQDGIIRSLYESNDGILGSVSNEEISIAACIQFLETEATGGRLTKELIESWFSAGDCESAVILLISAKLGFPESLTPAQQETVTKHVNAYRAVIASLAGGKTILSPLQLKSIRTVLENIDEDEISKRLMSRITAMENPKKVEELLEI